MQESTFDFKLGDYRLGYRADRILFRLNENPGLSFPKAFTEYAELEGLYRFLGNDRVSVESLLDGIVNDSIRRIGSASELLVLHDTTEICPESKVSNIEEFHPLQQTNGRQGFLAHLSLLVKPAQTPNTNAEILGAVGLHMWTRDPKRVTRRPKKSTEPRESERWAEQALNVQSTLNKPVIHVMDRECDSYNLFWEFKKSDIRYVVRGNHNRCLLEDAESNADGLKLFEFLAKQPPITTRTVQLNARKASALLRSRKAHPPRATRTAHLQISASAVTMKRNDRFTLRDGYPEGVAINVVRVFESSAPEGEKPVEWHLYTSEPIDTPEQLERIIDIYKTRWIIEEYFKALKTGCNFERRLLESANGWYRALVLFLPIARNLYNLKTLSESTALDENCDVFSPIQIQILKHLAKKNLTQC